MSIQPSVGPVPCLGWFGDGAMVLISPTKPTTSPSLPAGLAGEKAAVGKTPSSNMPDDVAALRRELAETRRREALLRTSLICLRGQMASKESELENLRSSWRIFPCCTRRRVPAAAESSPTQKQIDYVWLLARKKGWDTEFIRCMVDGIASKSRASSLIDALLEKTE